MMKCLGVIKGRKIEILTLGKQPEFIQKNENQSELSR